jgi:hypothetical protein
VFNPSSFRFRFRMLFAQKNQLSFALLFLCIVFKVPATPVWGAYLIYHESAPQSSKKQNYFAVSAGTREPS